jgi:hypothetical protein
MRDTSIGIYLCCLLVACSTGPKMSRDPQVAACQESAKSATPQGFDDSKVAHLTAQADAFSVCMEKLGYALDEEEYAERLSYFKWVKASDVSYGDTSQAVAAKKQVLRLTPDLWRKGPRASS